MKSKANEGNEKAENGLRGVGEGVAKVNVPKCADLCSFQRIFFRVWGGGQVGEAVVGVDVQKCPQMSRF